MRINLDVYYKDGRKEKTEIDGVVKENSPDQLANAISTLLGMHMDRFNIVHSGKILRGIIPFYKMGINVSELKVLSIIEHSNMEPVYLGCASVDIQPRKEPNVQNNIIIQNKLDRLIELRSITIDKFKNADAFWCAQLLRLIYELDEKITECEKELLK